MQRKQIALLPMVDDSVQPTAIIYGCMDRRLTLAHRNFAENILGLKPGQYYPHRVAGSVNDLISPNESVRCNAMSAVKIMIENGITSFYFLSHTGCAGDMANKNTFSHPDHDCDFQEEKLTRAVAKIREFSEANLTPVLAKAYVLDLVNAAEGGIPLVELVSDKEMEWDELNSAYPLPISHVDQVSGASA